MGKKSVTLMPKTGKILEEMGEQIRLARMRRKITVALVAERAGVSRASVWAVEKVLRRSLSAFTLRFFTRLMVWIKICLRLLLMTNSVKSFVT